MGQGPSLHDTPKDVLLSGDDVIAAVGAARLEIVRSVAEKYWNRNGRDSTKPDEWRDRARSLYDVGFQPLMGRGIPTCAVWGSGSFSTGRQELHEAARLERRLGWSPVVYVGVVTNASTKDMPDLPARCKAERVAGEFKKKIVAKDFVAWYRDAIDGRSENPVRETRFFYPPGSIDVPPEAELRRRFELRQRFEREALVPEMREVFGELPFSASLRGYSFPIMTPHAAMQVDDTHPADLSYVDAAGHALYPGWQEGATAGMIRDGLPAYRSSLITVNPATTFELAQSVDSGELLALGAGMASEDAPAEAKKVQAHLKQADDNVLCALKATGLLRLWSFSTKPMPVGYRTLDGGSVEVMQRAVLVGDHLYSGDDAFGQSMSDYSWLASL